MDTYCVINRAEWSFAILRRARALPLFALDGWRGGWMMGWTMLDGHNFLNIDSI
jgi:hypothetical protein